MPDGDIAAVLKGIAVGEVWGIGPRSSRKLAGRGIRTAFDLSRADEAWVRRNLSVTGVRTSNELRGNPSFSLEQTPPPSRSLACSRSFGTPVSTLAEMQ